MIGIRTYPTLGVTMAPLFEFLGRSASERTFGKIDTNRGSVSISGRSKSVDVVIDEPARSKLKRWLDSDEGVPPEELVIEIAETAYVTAYHLMALHRGFPPC